SRWRRNDVAPLTSQEATFRLASKTTTSSARHINWISEPVQRLLVAARFILCQLRPLPWRRLPATRQTGGYQMHRVCGTVSSLYATGLSSAPEKAAERCCLLP